MKSVKRKIVATIEARMGSSRLPGKVLMEVNKRKILSYLIERLKFSKYIDEIIIATSTNYLDDKIVDFAKSENINYFRGSEDNVMLRVIKTAEYGNADIIVEITGDCPLIDPEIIDNVISTYLVNNADYVSNCNIRGYPDGMDVEVYSLKTLKKSYRLTKNRLHREHVSLHIQENPKIFKLINLVPNHDLFYPDLGLTLDEMDDFKLLKEIILKMYKPNSYFTCKDIIEFLSKKPKLKEINKSVKRKY